MIAFTQKLGIDYFRKVTLLLVRTAGQTRDSEFKSVVHYKI